jgi:hypothetical protein
VPSSRFSALRTGLSERFASAWVLLSETTNFLSRTNAFPHYELQLQDMRRRLRGGEKVPGLIRSIKAELVELRSSLRLQGYDLALGARELEVRGFRNDASIGEGFTRLALYIGARNVYWLAGESNHIELGRWLDLSFAEAGSDDILQKHYLWYQWTNALLTLSGADTERPEDFEALKAFVADKDRKLWLLSRLKKLK